MDFFCFRALLAFVIYLIVGAIIMYKVRGARGLEVIPQYLFWKDFPFMLVVSWLACIICRGRCNLCVFFPQDGCFFVISPCYKRSNYQKI